MAASTILLGRSSACLLGSGSQFYSRYLSVNRSHNIIPTCIFCARQLCSSSPPNNSKQPAKNQPTVVSEILAELESMKKELNTLRKERQSKKEQPIERVAVVKEKHPLLKSIELELSKSEELNCETEELKLPHGFQVESDKPGAASLTLKRTHQNEIINIELSIPAYYVMLLKVKVTLSGVFSGFFNTTEAVFQCTYTSNGFQVEKIKEPIGTDHGIVFYNLPKNLKEEFYKYLEARGLHKNNLCILYKYMVSRTNRENLRSLEKFKIMVEAV